MSFPPWNVMSAPKVLAPTPNDHSQLFTLQHLSTQIIETTTNGCCAGAAVWGAKLPEGEIFVAFDWQEMRQGVALLADPNGIVSNASFLNDAGEEEALLRQIIALTRLLHLTPWQDVAVAEANKQRATRASAGATRAASRAAGNVTRANIRVRSAQAMLKAA